MTQIQPFSMCFVCAIEATITYQKDRTQNEDDDGYEKHLDDDYVSQTRDAERKPPDVRRGEAARVDRGKEEDIVPNEVSERHDCETGLEPM